MASATTSTSISVRVRHAKSNDADVLIKLQKEIYSEARWFVGDGPNRIETLTRRLRSLQADQSLYLLATCKRDVEELCGWLELHRHNPKKLNHVAVLTLAVSQKWRKQGIAKGLLKNAYVWAKRIGITKIQLHVRSGNTAAIQLYESQGFILEGREYQQIYDDGQYEDNLLMAKFL